MDCICILQVFAASLVCLILYWLATGDSDFTTFLFELCGRSTKPYYSDKVVWVTGASSGIGEEIAYNVAASPNVRLVLSARRAAELQRVKLRCLEKNWELSDEDILVLPLDLSDLDSLPDVAAKAHAHFGRLDVVIHNAGRSQRAEWADVEATVDLDCFTLNALGPVVLTRALLPKLLGQPGGAQVLAISSIGGVFPAPLSPSYTAAKHAMNGYFRSLWMETGDRGVRVSIVCPSLTYAPNNPATAFTSTSGQAHGEAIGGPGPGHMLASRVAQLVSVAAANNLAEVWLAKRKQILAIVWINVTFPGLAKMVIRLVGLEKLRKARTGKQN